MKSKTYQKEGWFILEEENSVFGFDAGNTDKLDSEKNAIFIIENKEEIQNKTEVSSKALTDFFDSVTDDLPEPSEEEIDSGIAKVLERTHPEAVKEEPSKTTKSKKVTFRVLFIAALLSVLSFTGLLAVGNNHNISIENGFATFAKDTVKIVFFDETEEKYIDVKTLLEDLDSNGFRNILIPLELYTFKSTLPVYSKVVGNAEPNNKVSFELYNDTTSYSFGICYTGQDKITGNYFPDVDNTKTLLVDDVYVYIFELENGVSTIRFVCDGHDYYIQSEIDITEMINIAQTIINLEE